MTTDASTLRRLRRILLALFLASAAGSILDLVLIEHTEDAWQWVPIVLLALGVPAAVLAALRPGPATLGLFRVLLGLMVLSCAVGLWLHYVANTEFALESQPDLAGAALFFKAIHGASPPSLAPGAMLVVGAVGLAWSFGQTPAPPSPSPPEGVS